MNDLIDRQQAIDALKRDEALVRAFGYQYVIDAVQELPTVQPDNRWNRLMMYLAELQLTYSPGWGANGQGDEKLYEFVTGLIEELENWEHKKEK